MTSEELVLLTQYAHQTEDGRWYFHLLYPHSAKDAVQIIKTCLFLGVPVTDIVTSEAWYAMAMKIQALEKRLDDDGKQPAHYGSKF